MFIQEAPESRNQETTDKQTWPEDALAEYVIACAASGNGPDSLTGSCLVIEEHCCLVSYICSTFARVFAFVFLLALLLVCVWPSALRAGVIFLVLWATLIGRLIRDTCTTQVHPCQPSPTCNTILVLIESWSQVCHKAHVVRVSGTRA